MLASNDVVDLQKIRYPKYASYKLDGIRVVFHPVLGMVSRSLKPIQNLQLQNKFQELVLKAKTEGIIFDGEFYAHGRTFQEITSAVMTKDFYDDKTFKKYIKEFGEDANDYILDLLRSIRFHCFEYVYKPEQPFLEKLDVFDSLTEENLLVAAVPQIMVHCAKDVEELFEIALKDGYEGLILRDPYSPYKFGRSTLKEEAMLKVKPYKTFDGKIIGVVQSTEVNPEAEKKINELGRSVTSKKKDDRVLIEQASAFWVNYEDHALKVSLAMTDTEKKAIWHNKDFYIGKMIEYKGMLVGAKDVPRHAIMLRFREDRE